MPDTEELDEHPSNSSAQGVPLSDTVSTLTPALASMSCFADGCSFPDEGLGLEPRSDFEVSPLSGFTCQPELGESAEDGLGATLRELPWDTSGFLAA